MKECTLAAVIFAGAVLWLSIVVVWCVCTAIDRDGGHASGNRKDSEEV